MAALGYRPSHLEQPDRIYRNNNSFVQVVVWKND